MVKIFLVLITFFMCTGCGVKDIGTRTLSFGSDGITVESETVELKPEALVDIEKEKTRQVCYKQKSKQDKSLIEAVVKNPLALAMYEQAKALNNALSLLATGKSYDPCPSSTNSSDVEIADSKMYSKIYGDAFSLLRFSAGVWGGVEVAGSLFDAMAVGGYSFLLNGENSSVGISDSFKSSTFGDGATTGNLFSGSVPSAEPEVPDTVDQPEEEL